MIIAHLRRKPCSENELLHMSCPVLVAFAPCLCVLNYMCIAAVEFLWDLLIESVDQVKNSAEGAGCILAHCMGLGKTLSVSN